MSLTTELQSFFSFISGGAADKALQLDLPFIGDAINDATAGLDFFSDLNTKIAQAVAGKTTATEIADALNGIPGNPVHATVNGSAVEFTIVAQAATTRHVDDALDLNVGGSAIGLTGQGDIDATITTDLNVKLSFDTATGALSYLDNGTEELKFGLDIGADLQSLQAKLGPIGLIVTDKNPSPEFQLDLGLDIDSLTSGGVSLTVGGAVHLNLGLETTDYNSLDFLPKFYADLNLDFAYGGSATPTASIAFDHVAVDLGSLARQVARVMEPITDFLNIRPIGEIIDALTEPLPIIDDGIRGIGLTSTFDINPIGGGDDIINVLDVYAAQLKQQGDQAGLQKLKVFTEALSVLKQLHDLNNSGGTRIELGSFDVVGGAPTSFTVAEIAGKLPSEIAEAIVAAEKTFNQVVDKIRGLIDSGEASLGPFNGLLEEDKGGIAFPIIDDPSKVINILLPGLTGNQPVDLVVYNFPEQNIPAVLPPQFFPIIGPLGISFDAAFNATIDFNVKYDTYALLNNLSFVEGIVLTTDRLNQAGQPVKYLPGQPTPEDDPPGEVYEYEPLAFMHASTHLGLGLGLNGDNGVFIEGGIAGFAAAFLPNGELRYNDLVAGCIFDPTGRITADLSVRLSIGFGFLKFTHRETLLETTLVDFTYKCDGGATDPGFGLAHLDGTQMKLHVGTDAALRRIGGIHGTDVGESIHITNAIDASGLLIPGTLSVQFTNIQENYGLGAAPGSVITANFNQGADRLVLDGMVLVAANVSAGAGDDLLVGGGGDDTLNGDGESDILRGNGGIDHLNGGSGDDTLDGGAGGDIMDGGDGLFDQVTYINSAVGVEFTSTGPNTFTGKGGDADGDQLTNIEYIVGSNFDDKLFANNALASTLEGRDGVDVLIGGNGDDYLLGGRGGDTLEGGEGYDSTSYLTSWGRVVIDLRFNIFDGGDATGDHINSVENVQGTAFEDRLQGSIAKNHLDGWFGDDFIIGYGGQDWLEGGAGNDIVAGAADGGKLDGGAGRDLLTYTYVGNRSVTANLKTGTSDDTIVLTERAGYSTFEDLEGTSYAASGDSLTGDLGYNLIRGLAGNDIINGDDGNDTLVGGAGADTLDGGAGIDLADYSDLGNAVTVDLSLHSGQNGHAAGDQLFNIENLRGSDRPDTLIGDDGANVIDPYLSKTKFNGNLIDDVDGRGGDDTLLVDYGNYNDTGAGMSGGYDLGSLQAGTFLRPDRTSGNLDGVTFRSIERLVVNGTIKGDTIHAGAGNDIVTTNGGDDIVYAGTGYDVVLAGTGNDFVAYNTDANRQLTTSNLSPSLFLLAGERGIDTLSASFANATGNIHLEGSAPGVEAGINATFSDGGAVTGFEILKDIYTGSGDDELEQLGEHNNIFQTGAGDDTIRPGLGIDTVDGGFDMLGITGVSDDDVLVTEEYYTRHGDTLVLDYSSLSGYGVTSASIYTRRDTGAGFKDVEVTSGFYEGWGADPQAATKLHLDFNDIERIDVTGSSQSDVLSGTHIPFGSFWLDENARQLRGDDTLRGGGGNDLLLGYSGDDVLNGGDGNDTLVGANMDWNDEGAELDFAEVDSLTGGAGADLFVLGVAASTDRNYNAGSLYNDVGNSGLSRPNQAILEDFNPVEGDQIQLFGVASDYRTAESNGSTLIYIKDGSGGDSARDELIATVKNFTGFSLNASYVTYVDADAPVELTPLPDGSPGVPENPGETGDSAAGFGAPDGFAAAAASSWVTQNNDGQALIDKLFEGAVNDGIDHSKDRYELIGNGDGFGTFDGDPFGIGSGIVLSTGSVADLPSANTEDGGVDRGTSVPLTFTNIGRYNGSDIFRADLSALGIDIKSLSFKDLNNFFGGDGYYSGYDIDAIALSRTFTDDPTVMNDQTLLPRLNVFDFNAAGIVYRPGTQHQGPGPGGGDFDFGSNLYGAVNGLVDNGLVRLDVFNGIGSGINNTLSVSIGDSGFIGFNLTDKVSTDGPLYLYIAEAGASGESLEGAVSASSGRIDTRNDLSTDFGAPGAQDDTTRFVYHFTPDSTADVDSIFFQFSIFSEELREFAGSEFNDSFSIKLNGVSLAQLSDGAALSVNALMQGPLGPTHPDVILNTVGSANAVDTRADAYTKLLTFAGALQAGENTLEIEVADVRDGLLDSGILVKSGTFKAALAGIGAGGGGMGANGGGAGNSNGSGGSGGGGVHFPSGLPPLVVGNPPVNIPIEIDPGADGNSGGIVVKVTPPPNVDIGNGPGQPGQYTIPPGGPYVVELPARATGGSDGTGNAIFKVEVTGDPDIPAVSYLVVAVAPVNDAPVNGLPVSLEFEANVSTAIHGLSVADVDAGDGVLTTTLSVQFGILNVAPVTGGAAVAGSGTATVTLTGTLAEINATLAGDSVAYAGPQDFFGTDTLTMTTNDHGSTGTGGALTDTDQAAIHLNTFVHGTPADDHFTALPGNEFITGQRGNDSITFDFALVDADITYRGNQVIVDGPQGSHTVLNGFEIFEFTDGTVNNSDGDYLVDDLFYYSQNHDVWNAHVDADFHYHAAGWHEGRDPNAFFDTSFYLALNSDVKAAGINPLAHFHLAGWHEGRIPSLDFDIADYLALNPDVAAAKVDPLEHFLRYGAEESRVPVTRSHLLAANGFDYAYYLLHNPDVAAAGIDPFWHFEAVGWKEGRDPNALFDVDGYLAAYTDVANAQINPLDHYNQFGWQEGRDPSLDFDTRSYLTQNPDVAAAHINPLNHYLVLGIHEGRSAVADGVWG